MARCRIKLEEMPEEGEKEDLVRAEGVEPEIIDWTCLFGGPAEATRRL